MRYPKYNPDYDKLGARNKVIGKEIKVLVNEKDIEYKNVHHKVFEFQALSNVKFLAKMDTIKLVFI